MKHSSLLKLSAIAFFSLFASCSEEKKDEPLNDQKKASSAQAPKSEQQKKTPKQDHQNTTSQQNRSRISDVLTDTENILPKVAQAASNVIVGDNGGLMVKGAVELTLNDADQLTLIFDEIQKPDTKITVLINSEPATLNQEGNTYTTRPITEKLPAEINLSIITPEETITDIIQVDSGQCDKCNNLKLACTCNN